MKFFDRLLTIIITATLTSAVWIVFGSAFTDLAEGNSSDASEPAEAPADASVEPPVPGDDVAPPAFGKAEPSAAPDRVSADTRPETSAAASDRSASASSKLAMPVQGVSPSDLTDTFFEPRGKDGVRLHEAIDIMAPKGTQVIAAAPGTIAKIHASKAGGKSIYVRSMDKKTLYYYAHLDAYAAGLSEGASLSVGQALGTVGSTGNAAPEAPHLHFAVFQTTADAEWWEPANPVNPYPLLTGSVGSAG